jgi:lipoyl(octanoyl) transferase
MTEHWYLLQSGSCPAAENMAVDEALLEATARFERPVLRFYGWSEAAASFGYSQRYAELTGATTLRPLIRRPTGGGLVPHDADWTYSLVFPPTHPWYGLKAVESYRRLHEWLRAAFARGGVATELSAQTVKEFPGRCFVGWDRFDLLWQGNKIAGAAQRRTRQGLLIQGSIQPSGIVTARADWQQALCEAARLDWNVQWQDLEWAPQLAERIEGLVREKYSQPSYNQRR